MKAALAGAFVFIALVSLGLYYSFHTPTANMRREVTQALEELNAAVTAQDRARVSAALTKLLTDKAEVKLDIRFFSLAHQNNGFTQTFSKPDFIGFIDNTLYSLTNYSHEAQLDEMHPSVTRTSASVTFSGTEHGDGNAYFSGTALMMRFSTETQCTAEAEFAGKQVTLSKVACTATLASLPKPGQEEKLRNPEALKLLLQR